VIVVLERFEANSWTSRTPPRHVLGRASSLLTRVGVDDAINGARRPLAEQPKRLTSTYAHDGATRVRAPGALSHPARKRAWGSYLFSVLVMAGRPSGLADSRGSSMVRGRRSRRPCPRYNCPHSPALPWPPPHTPSLPRPSSSHSPAPALVPVRWTVRVDGQAACQAAAAATAPALAVATIGRSRAALTSLAPSLSTFAQAAAARSSHSRSLKPQPEGRLSCTAKSLPAIYL
jgi:hypothetical protein